MIYAVVTKIDTQDVATAMDLVVRTAQGTQETDYRDTYVPAFQALGFDATLALHIPVWTLGEIVVLAYSGGREVNGAQRKPSKWFVEVEEFDTIEAAVNRAIEVSGA